MPSPSSTSSSELTAPLVALILAGVLLAGFSAVAEHVNLLDRGDRFTPALHVLEQSQPKVLFFGSSLTHASIDPTTVSRVMGVPKSSVVVLADAGFDVWHMEALLERETIDLHGVLAVVEVKPWAMNERPVHPIRQVPEAETDFFYRWANWEQLSYRPGELASASARQLFPVLRMRRPLSLWGAYARDLRKPWPETLPPSAANYGTPAQIDALRKAEAFLPHVIFTGTMNNYHHSDRKFQRIRRVADQLSAKGASVVLYFPVVLPSCYDYVQADPERARQWQLTMQAMEELSETYPLYHFAGPAELGLTEDMYVDYGHMTLDGAKITSKFLANRLLADGLAPK